MRFAAAVQAALEDGYRVFAEVSPHPLLSHALDQTARNLDIPLAAVAGMRREQPLPFGLRGFVADVHNAGAAVDFSVLYPAGRLVDAPLPTWTHRRLFWNREAQDSPMHGACTVSVHPLLGSHVRLQEEPERHAWQAEVGTDAQPWLGDHRIRDVAVMPGRGTARWRWRPRERCWVKLPRSATFASSGRCGWMHRPRSALRRR
ncbi:acyl transferase domain protein [Mycobacterium xenopi 3993]|nr:acyl transferase domain protein [Mycobacterium xenopi 3993]